MTGKVSMRLKPRDAAAGTAVPAACSGNMLDLAESASAMPIRAEARGFHPHMPLGEAAAGAANIKHIFDSRLPLLEVSTQVSTKVPGRLSAQAPRCRCSLT